MDNIEKLLKEIKQDRSIWTHKGRPMRYSGSFLKTVGDIFEKGGFGESKVYLMNLVGRNRPDAEKLLQILKKFENTPEVVTRRALGKAIISSLTTIEKLEV